MEHFNLILTQPMHSDPKMEAHSGTKMEAHSGTKMEAHVTPVCQGVLKS